MFERAFTTKSVFEHAQTVEANAQKFVACYFACSFCVLSGKVEWTVFIIMFLLVQIPIFIVETNRNL